METHMQVKTDTRVLVCRHTVPLMEERTLLCRAWGVTGEPKGHTEARLSLHRKLLRHAGHVCFHVYWPNTHTEAGALTNSHALIKLWWFVRTRVWMKPGKVWTDYRITWLLLFFFIIYLFLFQFLINAVWFDVSVHKPPSSSAPNEITCMDSVHAYTLHTLIEG